VAVRHTTAAAAVDAAPVRCTHDESTSFSDGRLRVAYIHCRTSLHAAEFIAAVVRTASLHEQDVSENRLRSPVGLLPIAGGLVENYKVSTIRWSRKRMESERQIK